MTKDNLVKRLFQDLTFNDTHQQQQQQQRQEQKPFHVVLVDIEKADDDRCIHCIERPLEGDIEELKFVALSYRWGELHEQMVDTKCGYIASITSFALDDFYRLCSFMREEPDLKSIKYVWVDAICVDQTNYERRKATIHQMSNIYEKATYILAVPDLHRQHLMDVSQANERIMKNLYYYHYIYIYYLIQGNTEQLAQLDSEFLDKNDVPKDPILRRMLTKCTNCFMDGFTKNMDYDYRVIPEILVGQLYDISNGEPLINDHTCGDAAIGKRKTQTDSYAHFEDLFGCNKTDFQMDKYCDLEWRGKRHKNGAPALSWKDYIITRNNDIRQIMKLLNDLIVDWSSRVWVISEYHIAKKKNNLKFWFIGLSYPWEFRGFPFFEFDFADSTLSSAGGNAELDLGEESSIYLQFHKTMTRQLVTQSFIEMMLCGKASKIEDRLYAILPQSKYKDKINQVADWKINNLLSVKLKLFEIMDTKDKLTLLFLAAGEGPSGSGFASYESYTNRLFPTFATSAISKSTCNFFAPEYPLNFDLDNKSTIALHHHTRDSHPSYFLQLTPKKYAVIDLYYVYSFEPNIIRDPYDITENQDMEFIESKIEMACNDLQLNEASRDISLVFITYFDTSTLESNAQRKPSNMCPLYLFGSFKKNKWIVTTPHEKVTYWDRSYFDNDSGTVFNIY